MFIGNGIAINSGNFIPAEASPYLDGIIPETVAQYSGLYSDSADGTGNTFKNLISSPSDGSSQEDWDLDTDFLSTTPPVWNASKQRWVANHDGGFQFNNQAGPTSLLNAHKNVDGGPFTIVYYGFVPEFEVGGIVGGPAHGGGQKGINLQFNKPGSLVHELRLSDGTNSVSIAFGNNSNTTTPAYQNGETLFAIVTFDPTSTTDNVKAWVNSRTPETLSMTFTSNDAADANYFVWGWDDGLGNFIGSVNADTEFQDLAFINKFVTQADADAIINYYQSLTGECIVHDDTGDATNVEYLVINLKKNGDNGNVQYHDFAVRDTEGNDLLPSLTDFGTSEKLVSSRQEVTGGKYGVFCHQTVSDNARLWNDAAWDDGGTPQANTTLYRWSPVLNAGDGFMRVVLAFSEPKSIGSIAYYIDNATTRVPDEFLIFSQDGIITPVSTPTDVNDYIYTDGGDKRAYEIVLQ